MIWPTVYRSIDVDPFRDMRRLQREVNRLFSGYSPQNEAYPAMNIWSNNDEIIITAEVPGIDPAELELTVNGNQFSLKGERKAETTTDDKVCHRCERGTGAFVRSLTLPFDVENAKVNAKYKNGILSVTLPRAEASKPKQIAVNAG